MCGRINPLDAFAKDDFGRAVVDSWRNLTSLSAILNRSGVPGRILSAFDDHKSDQKSIEAVSVHDSQKRCKILA